MVLCLLKKEGQAFVSFVGGSPGDASRSLAAKPPGLPPTIRLLASWLLRSALFFLPSGGLTRGMPLANSFPFDPFLGSGMVYGVLRTGLLRGTG
jgi:hypothetical protein